MSCACSFTYKHRHKRIEGTHTHTQDRWVQLGGSETGELRVRMAVVAGAPDSPSVQQMVSLLSSSDYAQASVPTLQVCVCVCLCV